MKKIKLLVAAMVVGLSIGGWGQSANAGLVLDITGGFTATDSRDFTLGYSFTVNSAITIDGLGVWDEGSNGMSPSVDVALWNAAAAILRTATVTSGSTPVTSAVAAGRWLFEDVAQITLAPGDYVVGYQRPGGTDPWRFSPFTTIPEITFNNALELGVSTLTFPTSNSGTNKHFGPNLRTVDSQIPEPATLTLFGLGLAGLGFARRRKQKGA